MSALCRLASMAKGDAPFWAAPEVDVVDELSSTVWASVVNPSEIACCAAACEVELDTCSKRDALASRVIESTSAPPYEFVTRFAISREYPGVLTLAMLFETTAVCAELTAKEELMTLNAVDRLIEASWARSASRLQPVQDVENVGPGLKHLGIGLVGALGLDHLGQFRGQIDRRAFEGRGFDRAEA